MTNKEIVIASVFSREPFGRTDKDGKFNGTKFRTTFLSPPLREGKSIILNFDGAEGYGSSFLEESFGGLIREGFSLSDIKQKISFISTEDPSIVDEINEYLEDESKRQIQMKK